MNTCYYGIFSYKTVRERISLKKKKKLTNNELKIYIPYIKSTMKLKYSFLLIFVFIIILAG